MPEDEKDVPRGMTMSEDGQLLNWRGVNYVRQDAEQDAGRECGCGCDPWPNGSCGERAPGDPSGTAGEVAPPPTCLICGDSEVVQEAHNGGTHPVHCTCTYSRDERFTSESMPGSSLRFRSTRLRNS